MQNVAVLPRPGRWLAAAVVALAALLPACEGPPTASTVDLAASSTNLYVGQSVQITPTVKDKSGKTLTGHVIVYQTSAANVVVVSSEGVVLAVAPGSAVITATVDGVTARLPFVVSLVPVSRIAMSRDTATVQAVTTLQLNATPQDSAGHALADRGLTWSSSDANVATVSSSGLVTGVAPGSATITATAEGKSGTTRVTVTPAAVATIDVSPGLSTIPEGATVQLTATVKDAAGHVLTGRTLSWVSSDVTKATVSQTGVVTGIAPGAANILVSSGSTLGGAAVFVVHIVAASVRITPDTATLVIGDTLRLHATVLDSAGNQILFRAASWLSINPAVVSVDSTGKLTAISGGTSPVIATRDNKADTAFITVVGLPASSMTLSPAPATLGLNRTGRLLVTLLDGSGNPTTRPLSFQVSDDNVLSVDSTGLMTGLAAGSTVITVSTGGISRFTSVTVDPVGVASVTPDSTSLTLGVGASYALKVTPRDAGANVLYNRTMAFVSADPTVAKVSPTGVVTALKSGSTTVTATSEGASTAVTVTVP